MSNSSMSNSTVQIAVLLPDLLGTYGDRGNALVLAQRLQWRGQPAEVLEVTSDQPIPGSCDIYVVGGGEDVAQMEATRLLERSPFRTAVEQGANVLAVCAGLQILGRSALDSNGEWYSGLGLLDVTTRPREQRAIGELVSKPEPGTGLGDEQLTGFENHQGGTELGPYAKPLARVVTGVGNGDLTEGVISDRIVGTYMHGPVLARNPQLADLLLTRATGLTLAPLHIEEIDELRRVTIAAAEKRKQSSSGRLRSALTPRRWLTPGLPNPAKDGGPSS